MDTSIAQEIKKQRWDAILARIPEDRAIIGAEIGVWRGGLSVKLLDARPKLTLYMIDRWCVPAEDDSYTHSGSNISKMKQHEYDMSHRMAVSRTRGFAHRAYIIEEESKKAAELFIEEQFDFVFIDADHSYDGVMGDLRAWEPTIKDGGWLCGHDWDHPDQGEVKRAVLEFLPEIEHSKIELDSGRTWFYRIAR